MKETDNEILHGSPFVSLLTMGTQVTSRLYVIAIILKHN